MIESVIEFRDRSVGEIMTPRTDITALEVTATLDEVKQMLAESGHSRLPVFEGTLDHIIGILYARDLLKYLGQLIEQINIREALRLPLYVPKTKPLRDLLNDFRLQKIHIAIVNDEYGGTGIVLGWTLLLNAADRAAWRARVRTWMGQTGSRAPLEPAEATA